MAPAEGAPPATDAPTGPSLTSSTTAGARAPVGGIDDDAGGGGIEAVEASEAGTATSATALSEREMAGGAARAGTATVGLDDVKEAFTETPLAATRGEAVVTPRGGTLSVRETAPSLGSSGFGNGTGRLFWVPSPPSSNGVATEGGFPMTTFVPVASACGVFCAFAGSVAATATGRLLTGGATLAAGGQAADGAGWMAPPATDAPVLPAAAPQAPGGNDDGAGGDGIEAEMALGAETAAVGVAGMTGA